MENILNNITAAVDTLTTELPSSESEFNVTGNITERERFTFPLIFFSREELASGWIAIHVIVCLYMFGYLAVICHHFFVPSLEKLADEIGLEESIAGAALLAGGGALPQLAVAIISLFVMKGTEGLQAIVGSSLFNSLFVVGISGVCAKEALQLNWWPVFRDSVGFLIAAILLALALVDEVISWMDSLLLIAGYFLYILVLVFNNTIKDFFENCFAKMQKGWYRCCCGPCKGTDYDKTSSEIIDEIKTEETKLVSGDLEKSKHDSIRKSGSDLSLDTVTLGDSSYQDSMNKVESGALMGGVYDPEYEKHRTEENHHEEYHSPMTPPDGCFYKIVWVIFLPVTLLAFLTTPDFKRPGCPKHMYIVTALFSIVGIGMSSYVLMWSISDIGDTFGMSSEVMSLTIIAIGGTLPDMFVSIITARQGHGEMAVCNALGSNINEILLGNGIPWLIATAVVLPEHSLPIKTNELYTMISLTLSAFFVYIAFSITRWRLTVKLGCVLCFAYLVTINGLNWYYSNIRQRLLGLGD